jgi:hypothetical protein
MAKYSHNKSMMKEQITPKFTDHVVDDQIMISDDKFNSLSQEAKYLYTTIYDYCTYSPDPQYHRLHQFRTQINKLEDRDRDILIEYFNTDPAICWPGISSKPWEYYAKPY